MKHHLSPHECSGQFRLRIPRELHTSLAREARSQGVSMNSYVLYLLSTRHSQEMIWQKTTDLYAHHLQDTVRAMHEMVRSINLGEPEPQDFFWRSTGTSSMIMQ